MLQKKKEFNNKILQEVKGEVENIKEKSNKSS